MLIGFSKAGLPGSGILVVPMMASVFGGHLSIGATLPMLILADIFAVVMYRSDADWPKIRSLIPWVFVGLALGVGFLLFLPHKPGTRDPLNAIIGATVILMLLIHLLRGKLGDKLVPHSPVGTAFTGTMAGFTTMASNAAGPIMSIYMTAAKLPKNKLMGTSAWYFFLINSAKVPLMLYVNSAKPSDPLITAESFQMNLMLVPMIIIGALLGKFLLPKISEAAFSTTILALAGIAALKLIIS